MLSRTSSFCRHKLIWDAVRGQHLLRGRSHGVELQYVPEVARVAALCLRGLVQRAKQSLDRTGVGGLVVQHLECGQLLVIWAVAGYGGMRRLVKRVGALPGSGVRHDVDEDTGGVGLAESGAGDALDIGVVPLVQFTRPGDPVAVHSVVGRSCGACICRGGIAQAIRERLWQCQSVRIGAPVVGCECIGDVLQFFIKYRVAFREVGAGVIHGRLQLLHFQRGGLGMPCGLQQAIGSLRCVVQEGMQV